MNLYIKIITLLIVILGISGCNLKKSQRLFNKSENVNFPYDNIRSSLKSTSLPNSIFDNSNSNIVKAFNVNYFPKSTKKSKINQRQYRKALFDGKVHEEEYKKYPRVNNPKLISMMPRNINEYRYIYREEATASINNEINSYRKRLEKNNNTYEIDELTLSALNKSIKESEGNPLVIFGHSEKNGRILTLSNRDKISVVDIHTKCIELNKNCFILTCDGKDFSIKGKISALEAISIWEKTIKDMNDEMNIYDMVFLMSYYREELRLRKKIYISFVVSTGISSAKILISENRSEPSFNKININN